MPDTATPAAPNPSPAAQTSTSSGPRATDTGGKKGGTVWGGDVPVLDPGTEIVTFNGMHWNISNNRLVKARLEKYLNAPEDTSATAMEYQKIISTVLNLLAPGKATAANVDRAFQHLPQGSHFDIDAHLCDALANAVFSAWQAQNARDRVASANEALMRELKQEIWNAEHSGAGDAIKQPPPKPAGPGGQPPPAQTSYEVSVTQLKHTQRIAELQAQINKNRLGNEVSKLQAKVEFQALILQFFMQRRFQHVLMSTRFYRAIFSEDTQLKMGTDTHDLFAKSTGLPPTVGTLDSLAEEAIRDVREGIQAFEYLLSQNKMESATKRLTEAAAVGEYLPEVRTLSREKKGRALDFIQKTDQLVSALDMKDYTLAEELVNDLKTSAKDFDNSKARAAIETARDVSAMHLAKAQNAAIRNDQAALEAALAAAMEIWPRNPDLKKMSVAISGQTNVQAQAVVAFDQLAGQKNFRQIFDDRARFLAALSLAGDKERQRQLEDVLNNVQSIEMAITQANALARQMNFAGAWETLERISAKFPDDAKLSQVRANLTTQAADFVRMIHGAQDLEKKDQVGSSLAWYLKAQKMYPQSEMAGEGVDRLVKKILPEG